MPQAEQIAASSLVLDSDDDNDGVLDIDDYFPTDPTKAGTPIQEALAGIVDPRLRECLEVTINGQFQNAIYAEQVTGFGCGADSIEGLKAFSRLENIYLGNNFTDISELQHLEYLSSLTLDNGPGPDSLEPLRGKLSLTYLQLHGANQAYTDVILTLTGLEGLQFQYSDIPVLPDYSTLPNLRRLDMYRTNTQDISSVSALTQLERFASWDNPLTEISPVASLTNLTFLALTDANASDISPLTNLVNVTELLLSGNNFYVAHRFVWDDPADKVGCRP